ncbi:MAG: hypothetical protein ABIP48_31175, partial [Planctomycetota bacterium]
FIRTAIGPSSGRRVDEKRRCPFCHLLMPRSRQRCEWCGRDLHSRLAAELDDLDGLDRQLKRFREAGTLKPAEVDDLLARAKQYRVRLTGEPVEARPEAGLITAELVEEPVKPKPPPPAAAKVEPSIAPKPEPPPAPKPSPAPKPPRAPRPPRKSWQETLTGFLEERNIRWAELVGVLTGGLLMVGASVALVISLWEKLDNPLFKFSVFVGYSSAVFGAGLFAHYRWKLESTGRGLLTIGTLLVPLNFLAMASLSQGSQGDSTWLNVAWEVVSLAIFVYLVGLAAGVLVPRGRWLQVGAVVGSSAAILVVARLAGVESHGGMFLAAGGLPVAVLAAGVGGFLYRLRGREDLDPGLAGELFSHLGTAAFAAAIALGLLVAQAVDPEEGIRATLDRASVLFALAAVPILAAGLTVVRGMSRDKTQGAYRTAGTAIALGAVALMLAALAMAWPQPWAMMAVGTFNAAALVFVAFRYRLPIAHAGAIASAAVVYLTGYHVFLANNVALMPTEDASRQMLRWALSAESGAALVGLFAILGVAAELLGRWVDRRHAEQYAGACLVVAMASLLMVTAGADAPLATAVYGLYGAGCLLLNARFRKLPLTYFGLGLLVGATLWALWWWQAGVVTPIWATILAAEALAMGVAALLVRRPSVHAPRLSEGDSPIFPAGKSGQSPAGSGQSAARRGGMPSRSVGMSPGEHGDASDAIPPDAYRVPLLHVAEAVGSIALVGGVWTAWWDPVMAYQTLVPVVTAVYLSALYLLLAWEYRSVERTWAGSMIALVGLVHTFVFNYTGYLDLPWLDALLAHATMAVLGGVLLEAWSQVRPGRRLADDLRRVFIKPLGETALLSSALAVPMLALVSWQETLSLSACLFWLAGVWLVIAWTHRWPAMLAAAQAVLALAVGVATTAWLQRHPWDISARVDLVDPRSLQVYGIGLGLLTLSWIAVRIGLRRNRVAEALLNPGWPAMDRIVGHAVVALGLLLAAVHLVPGCWRELGPGPRGLATIRFPLEAFGPTAWLLVAVLAVALLAALWHRWRESELASSLLLAATVPCLVAARFAGQEATVSALRWGLAVGLVVASAAVWERQRLLNWCRKAKGIIEVGSDGPRISRTVLLATMAGPVLFLTIVAAVVQIGGVAPGGPAAGSGFDAIGPELSYLVPLAVVMACLVGFALRETSAGYAFSAGLVAKLTVALGFLLGVVTRGGAIGAVELVTVLQLLAITAAAWAVLWITVRRWANVWQETPVPGVGGTLMNVQLGIGALAGGLVWAPAVFALVFYPASWHGWTIAAGSWIGWIALAAIVVAVVYRRQQAGLAVQPGMAGLVGLAAIGLLACTVRGLVPLASQWGYSIDPAWGYPWGYRTLMLGWGMYSLLVVLTTWWVASVRTLPGAQGPPQALIRAASGWVSAAGLLAVLLGLKAAFFHRLPEDLLWAAAAIALASAAGAAMSVWRRREGWAFAAAPGVNLAASLVVWYYQRELGFQEWWVLLVQANVIASAAVALVWLAARKRLYELRELTLGTSPLLAVQTLLAVAGNAVLVAVPVARLLEMPASLPGWAAQLAEPPGWIALGLAAGAAAWYLRQVAPGSLFHAVGGLGLAVGVLITCSTAGAGPRFAHADWLSYHVLFTSWAAVGLAALAVGLLGRNLRLAEQTDPNRRGPAPGSLPVFPSPVVQAWVTGIGTVVVGLALLYAGEDPVLPWWSARAVLAAGVMAGVLAMWLRLGAYVFLSGLLVNVAGTVIWMAWGPWNFAAVLYTNVLCLAVGSCVWTLLRPAHPEGVPGIKLGGRAWPFAHLAVQAGLAVLGVLVVISAVYDVWDIHRVSSLHDPATYQLGWLALAAAAVATTLLLWDRTARFPLKAWYSIGLIAVGMALGVRELSPRVFCWTAGHELAGFVLLTALLTRLLSRMKPAWQALRIPGHDNRFPNDWLPQVQAVVAGLALVLGAWISIDFAFDGINRAGVAWITGRTAGPLSACALLAAGVLIAGQSSGRWRVGWQCGTIALGALVLAEGCWAWLPPAWGVPWLHRSVILMAAAVVMALVSQFGLARILPAGSGWIVSGRRMLPLLGAVALVLLALVLVQEGVLPELPD